MIAYKTLSRLDFPVFLIWQADKINSYLWWQMEVEWKNFKIDLAGLWGGGKELLLELGDGSLRLIDADSGQVRLFIF